MNKIFIIFLLDIFITFVHLEKNVTFKICAYFKRSFNTFLCVFQYEVQKYCHKFCFQLCRVLIFVDSLIA